MMLQRTTLGRGGAPTFGRMTSRDGTFSCVTLERSIDGEHCAIPAGAYAVHRAVHHPGTPHAYPCPELDTSSLTPPRSYIHIHIANRVIELLGCIAVGEAIDGDAIDSSEHAFGRLMTYLANAFPFTLTILDPAG